MQFYNTRDVDNWPPPEVPVNVNEDELGDLGLTSAEEDAIVAFMKTLSDGYRLPKKKAHVNTGPHKLEFAISGPNPFKRRPVSLAERVFTETQKESSSWRLKERLLVLEPRINRRTV